MATATLPRHAPVSPRVEVDELVLTRWSLGDLDELAALHAEPETMAPFGGPFATRAESDAFAVRVDGWFDEHGFGLFAVHADARLLGAVGLAPIPPDIAVPFEAEVGWRLRRSAWGRGVATRAALAVLAWAEATGGPTQVCSFTATTNERSAATMRRVGLHRRADLDFLHPRIDEGDPRRPHVVYASTPAPSQ
ncbi:MAG TPA: GNAT family N-acetyltransferase [Acidimicrobiales bacterium]